MKLSFRMVSPAVLALVLATALSAGCASKAKPAEPMPTTPTTVSTPAPEPAPEVPAGEGWVSLFNGRDLDGWLASDIPGHGPVAVRDGTLTLGVGSPMTGINRATVPFSVNYEVSIQAKRLAGEDFFCALTFPIGSNCCSLIVGGWGGGLVGISNLDGYDASENETTSFQEFKSGQWYRIRLRVTASRVEAWIDAKRVVNVDIKNRLISVRPGDIESCKPFGLATYMTSAAYRDLRFRPLTDAETSQ